MSGLTIQEQGLGYIAACFKGYLGTGAYAVLGILGLLFLVIQKKKEGRFLFIGYPLALLCTVFNPVLMNPVIEKMGFEAEFYRFFWLLPISFFLSYVLVEVISDRKRLIQKTGILILVCAFVLIWNRDALKMAGTFSIPDNVYKAEDGLLEASELIHQNSSEKEPKVAFPLEYNLQARQYDPSLRLTLERNKMLYYLGITTAGTFSEEDPSYSRQAVIMDVICGGKQVNPRKLKKALSVTKTDYIVAFQFHDVHETLRKAGCTPIGETVDAVVYLTKYGKKHNL